MRPMNRRMRRRRARLRLAALAGPPATMVGLYLAGLGLAPFHRERERITLAAPPETVWAVLMDLDGMPGWRAHLESLERLPDSAGAVRWLETWTHGPLVLERVEVAPGRRFVVRQVRDGRSDLRWVYDLESAVAGSQLSVTEERRVPSPLLRPLLRLFGASRARIGQLTRDLALRLAAPQVAATEPDR